MKYTLEEYFKYCLTEEQQDNLDRYVEKVSQLESNVEQLEKAAEWREEQIWFAQSLIEQIEEICNENTKAKDIKRLIEIAISDSSFEG